MTDSSRTGHSSIEKQMPFAFANSPLSASDPATIVNPERRGLSPDQNQNLLAIPPGGSSLWTQLFPQALHPSDGASVGEASGVELDHFVIQDRIGSGGMAAVFRAHDSRLDRIVALKILGPNQSRDPASVQRFHNEARAAARLDHDNIARVYYNGEDKGVHFIAYEYVVGRTVRDLIHSAGKMEIPDAINITLQIAAALKHTAASGVVHRDIKPSNIIVSPAGRAKIVDLGLARKQESDSAPDLTIAGTTLGTFDYISPEQAKDPRKVDVRSDIYSLGCTLYHMLTGSAPYPEGTVLQKLLDHQDAKLPDPSEKNPRVSHQLSSVVQRMMASDPDERYQKPDDLIQDLMVIAASIGLRSVNPDGLVWAVPKVERPGFWERNVGWIATTAILLVIVSLLQFLPRSSSESVSKTKVIDPQGTNKHANEQVAKGKSGPVATPNDKPLVAPSETGSEPFDDAAIRIVSPDKGGNGEPRKTETREPILLPDVPSDLTDSVPSPIAPSTNTKPIVVDERPVVAVRPGPPQAPDRNGTKNAAVPDPFAPPEPTSLDPIVLTAEGGRVTAYPTLEAACRAAQDESVIVLNYDGQRVAPPERRLRIENKRITIRAGRRADDTLFRPLIVFEGPQRTTDAESRMISLINGSIKLINVDVQVSARGNTEAREWALFSFVGGNRVRLQGTRIAFFNPTQRPAAVFELNPSSRLDDMKNMPGTSQASRVDIEVEVVESFVRGGCDLFSIKHSLPGRFKFENSLVAVTGSFLSIVGDRETPPDSAELELQMDHVTCVVGKCLVKMDSGDETRELLPLSVTASNSVFAGSGSSPLVAMTGNSSMQDLAKNLHWDGERNAFDRFEKMWTVRPSSLTSASQNYNFDDWLRLWNSETEVNVSGNDSFWKRNGWRDKDFAEASVGDFALDEEHENVAISQGTDGENIGAELPRLEILLTSPQHTSEFRSGSEN